MTTSDEAEREELLLMRLLAGFDDDQPKEPLFLQPDSPEEKRARTVLAKQLREGRLGGFAKEFLALAIDPWTASTWPGMRSTVKVRFVSPAPGPRSTWARDMLIVHFIRDQLRKHGGPEDAALKAAEVQFNLGKSQTHAVWQRWKKSAGLSDQ
jgi:hypothetical protein